MTRRNMKYGNLARQGEAVGLTYLVHPFDNLWNQTKKEFLQEAIRLVAQGVPIPNIDDLLEDSGFGAETFTLDEWFQNHRPSALRLSMDRAGLRKSCEIPDDLAREEGLWKADAAGLDLPEKDAVSEVHDRLVNIKDQVSLTFGPAAASKVLEEIRSRFEEASRQWTHQPFAGRLVEELQQAAARLRSYAVPRTAFGKLLIRLRPGLPASWWLTESQCRNIETRLFPMITRAVEQRFEQEMHRRKRRVAEALLGRQGAQGIIDQVREIAESEEIFFEQLAASTAADESAAEVANGPNIIYTAQSLDAVLGSGGTLRDLYQQALRDAGCSAAEFAERLIQGVMIRGRTYKPREWSRLPLSRVQDALKQEADHYLGGHDPHKPFSRDDLRTAFDFARAITPLHPKLEPLVKNMVPRLAQRSKPFAEIQNIAKAESIVPALLYCYPSDRRKWEGLLQTWVTLVNSSKSPGDMEAYAIDNPHTIALIQFALAIPLGALKSLPSWMHQQVLLTRNSNMPTLHALPATPEVRRFAHRPDDYESCQLLFEAACKGRILVAVAGNASNPGRYALTTADPLFDSIFAPEVLEPDWKAMEFFHEKLGEPEFMRRLEISFAHVADLGPILRALARETDPHFVCSELVRLGVLDAGATGQHFRIRGTAHASLPLELFRRRKGPLQGLTADKCIGELHRNDDFFGTVFAQVCDAVALNRLSPNDVPEFVMDFVKTL